MYLDNAATAQRPQVVIDAVNDFYSYENANIHRGIYDLSNEATTRYEGVRQSIADFIGAASAENIGFTKGTTESINIVARSFVQPHLKEGDNIVTTVMEHHANFLPWQQVCEEKEAAFRLLSVTPEGDLDIDALDDLLDERTRILAVNHISNTIGTINPIEQIIKKAHQKGIPVLIDAAQSAAFYELNAAKLQCDFLAFSGHKLFGPFGTGILYVSDQYTKEIGPYNVGGGMIKQVAAEGSSFQAFPQNLEAGTPNISGIIGLGAAINYLQSLDRAKMVQYLDELRGYAEEKMRSIAEVKLVGAPKQKSSILSFTVDDIHPHDVASFLNKDGIAVRAGMHCTQPLLHQMQVSSTVRASFSTYNTKEEVDRLYASIVELIKFWS